MGVHSPTTLDGCTHCVAAAKMRRGDRDRKGERKRAGWKRGKTNNNRIRDRSRLTHLGIIEDEASTL